MVEGPSSESPDGPERFHPPGAPPPQYGQPQYGQPQYGQPQYGQPQYGQPQYGQPPPPPPPPSAYVPAVPVRKPGIIPLRPLSAGEILDGAFANLRQNPRPTIGLSFIVILIIELISVIVELALSNGSHGLVAGVSVALLVFQQIGAIILSGALTVVISEAVLGRHISAGDALRRIRPRIGGLITIALLTLVFVGLGLVLFLVGSIWIWVMLSFGAPALILENASPGTALRRSRQLVEGSWWRVFGILLVAGFIAGIVALILTGILTVILGGGASSVFAQPDSVSAWSRIATAIATVLAGSITRPISAGVTVLLYIDRRMRTEGLDLTLIRAAGPGNPPTPSAPPEPLPPQFPSQPPTAEGPPAEV